jgi:hypothetical protein
MKRTLFPLFLELSFLPKRGTAKGRRSVEDRNNMLSNKTCLESPDMFCLFHVSEIVKDFLRHRNKRRSL